jgi:hypothetical protein
VKRIHRPTFSLRPPGSRRRSVLPLSGGAWQIHPRPDWFVVLLAGNDADETRRACPPRMRASHRLGSCLRKSRFWNIASNFGARGRFPGLGMAGPGRGTTPTAADDQHRRRTGRVTGPDSAPGSPRPREGQVWADRAVPGAEVAAPRSAESWASPARYTVRPR